MIKFLLPLVGSLMLLCGVGAQSQELIVADQIVADQKMLDQADNGIGQELEAAPMIETQESLWQAASTNPSLENFGSYLAKFPNGKHAIDATAQLQALELKARARAKEDKQLDAYRKRSLANGLVLELDGKLSQVRPYVRSMLNTCGYKLVSAHRFAKRVYPTLAVDGQIFKSKSDAEYLVTVDLSMVLKTKTREIKVRGKMRSYRTSKIESHQALSAAFEDVGAQMKSAGFCLANQLH